LITFSTATKPPAISRTRCAQRAIFLLIGHLHYSPPATCDPLKWKPPTENVISRMRNVIRRKVTSCGVELHHVPDRQVSASGCHQDCGSGWTRQGTVDAFFTIDRNRGKALRERRRQRRQLQVSVARDEVKATSAPRSCSRSNPANLALALLRAFRPDPPAGLSSRMRGGSSDCQSDEPPYLIPPIAGRTP
jgi:hypothetical protein